MRKQSKKKEKDLEEEEGPEAEGIHIPSYGISSSTIAIFIPLDLNLTGLALVSSFQHLIFCMSHVYFLYNYVLSCRYGL